ncbi:MAG: hypothetical protein AAF500_14765 [Myxococcota bacterium]
MTDKGTMTLPRCALAGTTYLGEATDGVAAMLTELQAELGVSSSTMVLGGFSQGSMVACTVFAKGLQTADPVILSGSPVDLSMANSKAMSSL